MEAFLYVENLTFCCSLHESVILVVSAGTHQVAPVERGLALVTKMAIDAEAICDPRAGYTVEIDISS